jgi:hypothetical protein
LATSIPCTISGNSQISRSEELAERRAGWLKVGEIQFIRLFL